MMSDILADVDFFIYLIGPVVADASCYVLIANLSYSSTYPLFQTLGYSAAFPVRCSSEE